jgi:ABC-type sugar transport system ATPase subunit
MTAAVELKGVRIPFGGDLRVGSPGLEGINLHVAPGERVVLVGSSGVGKSTLLRAIAGLAPISGGELWIGGRPMAGVPPEARRAVYLHQEPVLFPHMTVEENIGFPLRIRGVHREMRRGQVDALLSQVRLAGFEHRLPHELSGGQRHRVALARAVIARPEVLLLDEPLTGLDPALRREIRDTILELLEGIPQGTNGERGAGVAPALLLVTHDLEDAGWIGTRVGILREGRLAQIDRPERLFRAPNSLALARFLGQGVEIPSKWIHATAEDPEGTFHVPTRSLTVVSAQPSDGSLCARGVVRHVRYPGASPVLEIELTAPEQRTLRIEAPGSGIERQGDLVWVSFQRDVATFFPTDQN